MDPHLQTLTLQLANVAARNTGTMIVGQVETIRARRKGQEAAAELEEIVNQLVSDKIELIGIAQAYEQELVAQRISQEDVEYITNSIVPVLTKLAELGEDDDDTGAVVEKMLAVVKPILAVETLTVMQLLGFNFRKAIGEPLTELVSNLISSRVKADPALGLEVQRTVVERDLAFFEIARDPDAYDRLRQMQGNQ